MAIFHYKDVEVKINNSGIMAEFVSINTSTNLEPVYILGKKDSINQTPNGPLQSTISIDHYLDTSYDPGFNLISILRTGHNTSNYTPETIVVAGITGQGYLSNYDIRISPNEPIKVSVNYLIYEDVSGNIVNKLPSTKFNITNSSGIAHGNTSFVTSTANYITGKIYDLNYSCNINWVPVYILGTKFPSQIQFMSAHEVFNFTREYYSGIQFSGQSLTGYFNFSDGTIDLYGLGYIRGYNDYLIQIPISGAVINKNDVSVNLGDFVRINTEANNYF